jgi:outer membrane protein OmpA-like peptidoglycan-associated protein
MNRNNVVSFLLCLVLTAFLGGCAPRNVFVLLPDQDGKVGKIEVVNDKGSTTIDAPGESITVAGANRAPEAAPVMSEREINRTFKEALAAEPRQPQIFLLYFQSGSTRLTDQSTALIPEILAAIKDRESLDISVIGHSDRAGAKEYNLVLSTERAASIRDLLVGRGVGAPLITVSSHGEGNPLVPTADDVEEPRNRRVEVVVR